VVSREMPASYCGPLLLQEYKSNRERLWGMLEQAEYDVE
jgi:hypothetical protein